MSSFITCLQERFPNSIISTIRESDGFDILQFTITSQKDYTIFCTKGLSNYKMPVSHNYKGKEHIELCFCAEADWDFNNVNYNWIPDKLEMLGKYMLEKQTWFGVGHTIPNGKPTVPLSKAFSQDYFFFDEASLLVEEFKPLTIDDRLIYFLFVIPISKVELDLKQKKTTFGFKKRMKRKGLTELLEDFRVEIADRDWLRFLKK